MPRAGSSPSLFGNDRVCQPPDTVLKHPLELGHYSLVNGKKFKSHKGEEFKNTVTWTTVPKSRLPSLRLVIPVYLELFLEALDEVSFFCSCGGTFPCYSKHLQFILQSMV